MFRDEDFKKPTLTKKQFDAKQLKFKKQVEKRKFCFGLLAQAKKAKENPDEELMSMSVMVAFAFVDKHLDDFEGNLSEEYDDIEFYFDEPENKQDKFKQITYIIENIPKVHLESVKKQFKDLYDKFLKEDGSEKTKNFMQDFENSLQVSEVTINSTPTNKK